MQVLENFMNSNNVQESRGKLGSFLQTPVRSKVPVIGQLYREYTQMHSDAFRDSSRGSNSPEFNVKFAVN